MNFIKLLFYLIMLLVVAPIYTYLNLPVLSYNFVSFPMEVLLISICIAVLEVRIKGEQKLSLGGKISLGIGLLTGVYIFFMWIGSWPMFRAESYRNLIGTIKQGESLTKDLTPVSLDQVRIVDKEMASRLGDKVLGEQPALGSQVDLGEFTVQQVKGKLYWVAPLLHDGFFRWSSNSKGTPGYVMVSATDERDVQLITSVKGKKIFLKYQLGAFFGDYLPRHVYFSGYYGTGTTDYSFEIDDEGEPYWVITLYHNTIGFGGGNAYGVITVHAETGKIQQYGLEDAPTWVDRIQPLDMVQSQLDDWGAYVRGYWNLSGQDVLTTTSELSLVYGENGRSYWYTGLTSVGKDQGTVGFVLVDTRNKQAIWYKQAGATEEAAQLSAAGKVQEKGYIAAKPIMYNINGLPTYVMALKDQAGLVKMVAMVSVEDFSVVGVGNNIKEALRSYKEAYNSTGSGGNVLHNTNKAMQIQGRIQRISQDITGGNSYYFFTLDQVNNKIFIGSSTISNELPLSQVGDSVLVKYEDARTGSVDIVGFDNLQIQTQTSTKEQLE